jgi:hypothetical protein
MRARPERTIHPKAVAAAKATKVVAAIIAKMRPGDVPARAARSLAERWRNTMTPAREKGANAVALAPPMRAMAKAVGDAPCARAKGNAKGARSATVGMFPRPVAVSTAPAAKAANANAPGARGSLATNLLTPELSAPD